MSQTSQRTSPWRTDPKVSALPRAEVRTVAMPVGVWRWLAAVFQFAAFGASANAARECVSAARSGIDSNRVNDTLAVG